MVRWNLAWPIIITLCVIWYVLDFMKVKLVECEKLNINNGKIIG